MCNDLWIIFPPHFLSENIFVKTLQNQLVSRFFFQNFCFRPLIPNEAPEEPEQWKDVMEDVERVIMPGVTHWHSPQFHAYFPTANSYPAIVADMLSDAIGCIGFSWIASPACTELEMVMMDWLGKMLDLPEEFLFSGPGQGGGVIQGTASEATLVALLSAKAKFVQEFKQSESQDEDKVTEFKSKLVAYASAQAHSSVERAGLLGNILILKVHPLTFISQQNPLKYHLEKSTL